MGVHEVCVAAPHGRARAYSARNGGTKRFHGVRRRFPAMPWPYATPKSRKDAGETTWTSTPAARSLLDRVADEHPGGVVRPPRVRRREDGDLHASRRPNTTGSATAAPAT